MSTSAFSRYVFPRVWSVIVAGLFVSSSLFSLPQEKPLPIKASVNYDSEAQVVEKAETTFRYNSDGTGERDLYERAKIQSEAGARQFSVISIPYVSASEKPEIETLTVHHPDGTTTETPAGDAMDMPAPVTQQAPLYSDLKMLQIPVRSLRTGDTIEFRVRIPRRNAESPEQFWQNFSFLKDIVVLSQTVTLDVPAGKYVQTWSPAIKPVVSENGGRRVSAWSTSQLTPTASTHKDKDSSPQLPASNKPDVAWTTFHNWQEVGEWYRTLAAPKVTPTDALRAKAGEIVGDAKSPEAQVQALYNFVSTHIRYVGVDFGVGRYQPHAAGEVLANQYGDCKDKDTLLESLLNAIDIHSAPALVGVNIDMVAEVPSPAFFNHLITTVDLPSGRVWMDSTPGVAPFQMLMPQVRDKDALVIPRDREAMLERTPAKPPFPFANRFEAKATLKDTGELNGHVEIEYRSDEEIGMRMVAESLAPAQWDQGTQYIANLFGFSGTTSNSRFARADDTSVPMEVSYDYNRRPFGDWDNFRIVPLFPINVLPAAPDKQPAEEINLGSLRTDTAVSRIKLPDGFGSDLPSAVHVKTPFAEFNKVYGLENGELIAQRTLTILQQKVPAADWAKYVTFTKDISLGEETWIQLTSKNTSGAGPHPPQAGENNPQAAQLVADATVLERSRDWAGAENKLDQAKQIERNQPFLWSNYGYVAMVQHKQSEANEDFSKELSLHPDEVFVVRLYGRYLHQQGEDEEARKVLTAYMQKSPSDADVARLLASIQAQSSYPDAIATLQHASEAAPSDHSIQSELGDDLIANHQNAEAAALAKTMMDAAPDDAMVLNNAAYLLVESNLDLPLAEERSRKAVQILEDKSASEPIDAANEETFGRTTLLVANWDTLGFILLQEKKLDEARDYIEAAWKNTSSADIGLHYGELQEASGQTKDALHTYNLTRSQLHSAANIPVQKQLDDRIARLQPSGSGPMFSPDGAAVLQQARTFSLKLKTPSKGFTSTTLRLQLAASGPPAVMQVSGKALPEDAEDAVKKLGLPHLVPIHSGGKILRDAVLTCSPGKTECFFVLMPMGSIAAERAAD
jgi:tetratricopeptide (TPR) repeat protein